MSSNRFYVPTLDLEKGNSLELPVEIGRQVSKVLRMREGDSLVLFNGSRHQFPAQITAVRKETVSVLLDEPVDPGTEPALQVTVYQALVPAERMEFVIQKCTELGAARIVPVVTERVQSRDSNISQNRLTRWERIATEAAEQSGRTRVPEVLPVIDLGECLTHSRSAGPVIVMWEEEHGLSLKQAVHESLSSKPEHVSVLIGPVGGLSGAEADAARSAGALIAGAGPRILRAETAPVVALTALMYETGELA